MTEGAQPPARRPPWKNPWILGGLLGILIVTLLRPILRRVPDAPAVGASLPAVRLSGPAGDVSIPGDLAGRVHVVALVEAECAAGTCERVLAGLVGLSRRQVEDGVPADVLLLAVGDGATPALQAAVRRLDAEAARVRVLDGSSDGACALARQAFASLARGEEVPCDELASLAHAARVALVDGSGRLRGLYATSELGLDELRHRAGHVVRDEAYVGESSAAP